MAALLDQAIYFWVAGEMVLVVGAGISVVFRSARYVWEMVSGPLIARGGDLWRAIRGSVVRSVSYLTAFVTFALCVYLAIAPTPPPPSPTPTPSHLQATPLLPPGSCTPVTGLASDALHNIRVALRPFSEIVKDIAHANEEFERSTTSLWILHIAVEEASSGLKEAARLGGDTGKDRAGLKALSSELRSRSLECEERCQELNASEGTKQAFLATLRQAQEDVLEEEKRRERYFKASQDLHDGSGTTWASDLTPASIAKALETLTYAIESVEVLSGLYSHDYCHTKLAASAGEAVDSIAKDGSTARRLAKVLEEEKVRSEG